MILLRPRLAQFISGYQYCTIGFTPLSVQYSSSGRSVLHVQFYLHITTFPSGDQRCLFSFTLMSLLCLWAICVARAVLPSYNYFSLGRSALPVQFHPHVITLPLGDQRCTCSFTLCHYSSFGQSALHVQFHPHITTFPSGDQRCLFSFTLMSLLLLRTICVARVPSCYCCSSDDQCFTCSVSPSCNHLFLRAISVARAVLPSCMCAPFRRSVPSADQRGLFSFTLMSLPLAGLPSRGGDARVSVS